LLCRSSPADTIPGTPLTLIAGPVNDVIENTKDSVVKSKLATAARNIDRLSRLVDSLMDFSRLEAGRMEGKSTIMYDF
jgi:signal transduction histidine kinase